MDYLSRSGSALNLKNEDLNFIQNAFKDALKGICSAYGISQSESFILSGCEITDDGTNLTIAEGYVALGGEICKVEQHTTPKEDLIGGNTDTNFWVIAPTNDPQGLRSVLSGGNENTWVKRRGKVVLEDAGLNPVRFDLNLPTIHELAANKVHDELETLVDSIQTNQVGNGLLNGWTGFARADKDPFGFVHVYMDVNGASKTGTKIWELPAGWKGHSYAATSEAGGSVTITNGEFNTTSGGSFKLSVSFRAIA